MPTTHKQLESMMQADSRMTSKGVLCSRNTELDALWAEWWTNHFLREQPPKLLTFSEFLTQRGHVAA